MDVPLLIRGYLDFLGEKWSIDWENVFFWGRVVTKNHPTLRNISLVVNVMFFTFSPHEKSLQITLSWIRGSDLHQCIQLWSSRADDWTGRNSPKWKGRIIVPNFHVHWVPANKNSVGKSNPAIKVDYGMTLCFPKVFTPLNFWRLDTHKRIPHLMPEIHCPNFCV